MSSEQERAIQKMLDVQWNTNWSPLPAEAEQHVEKAFEHLSKARDAAEDSDY